MNIATQKNLIIVWKSYPGSKYGSATYELCDLGQAAQPS